jgi:hypothetical protein
MKKTKDSVKVQGMFRVNITENGKVVGDSGWRKNQITNLGFNQYLVGSLGNISGKPAKQIAITDFSAVPAAVWGFPDGNTISSTIRHKQIDKADSAELAFVK